MRDIHTTLMGNATADPTARVQESGDDTAHVRIAVTGRYYDSSKSDFTDRKTEFITVYTRRALARNLVASVKKGQPLVVTGRLGSSEWTTDEGVQRYSLTLQAEAVGHDLSFGTSTFTRPMKSEDAPNLDPDSGEVLPETPQETDSALTEESVEDPDLAPAF